MNLIGTFSGIGGLEYPFHGQPGHAAVLMCDAWEASERVLKDRFPGVPYVDDIRSLSLSPESSQATALTAGFPCTDLSQAGRTRGIKGEESGLVSHVFRLLQEHESIETLILENVRNMLVLDRGAAMDYLVGELEGLGFRWAYRLVDSRFTGVPQRRHRVIFVATRGSGPDPRCVLFAQDEVEPDHDDGDHLRKDAFGFYWTEGERGLGWAVDAVPPLKGGSKVGIPSPPAIWIPSAPLGRRLVTPSIEHAEALQGFARGWTQAADTGGRNGPRWRLVGNAVTVGVSAWLAEQFAAPQEPVIVMDGPDIDGKWPTAGWGQNGRRSAVVASTWPRREPYSHLLDVCPPDECRPLSKKATEGFLRRLRKGNLRRLEAFESDVSAHIGSVS